MYRKHALRVVSALSGAYQLTHVLNEVKPLSKSFEIDIELKDGKRHGVWSGRALGPPRALKFPEEQQILDIVQKAIAQEEEEKK